MKRKRARKLVRGVVGADVAGQRLSPRASKGPAGLNQPASRPSRLLSDQAIDECFAKAASTIKEVEESLRPCFGIPASARGLLLR